MAQWSAADRSDRQERRRSWPLRAYFAALVGLFVVAAVAGAIFVRLQARDDARRAARHDAEFAASQAARPMSEGIAGLRMALRGVASQPGSSVLLEDPAACSLTFSEVGAFTSGHIDILRSDGSVACSSRGAAATLPSYAGADWLNQANAASAFEAPVLDTATGRAVALIAEPFPGGIAAAFLDLEPLGPTLAAQFGGRRALEFLVTNPHGGTILARSTDPAAWVGKSVDPTPFSETDVAEEDVDGTARLYGMATVGDIGWRVYAGADRAAALASADRLANRGLMIIGVALLVVLVAAFVVERRIARPIRRLSGSVRNARRGGPPAPLPTSGPAEVTTLADDFEGLMAAVERELAERKRAEEAARTSERTYRMLFEDNPQPMWIHDADTHAFLEVNDAAVAHYGYSRDEFLTMTVTDIRPPAPPRGPAESEALTQAMDHGPERHVRKDGRVIHVETTTHAVAFGGRQGQFVIAQDVTERERVQRQLYQKQRLESLGELAGGVAHDFNNLLAVMMNYAAFVRKDIRRAESTSDARRWDRIDGDLEQIEHAAERGARLTHQLLAFARSEVVRTEALDVNEVVEGLEQLLRRTIGEHIELVYRLGASLWPVVADRGQLEQVLVNLAVNARDAMPSGGTLSIETDTVGVDEEYAAVREGLTPGSYVRIRVSDTGTGMDESVVQHAFEPFFTTKPKGEGTGLGLATVHGIVAQAGGHTSIYSEPGFGTTFTALFPAVREELPEDSPAATKVRRPGRGERVLVVDDEPAVREVARRILDQNGYRVVSAPDGPSAVAIAEHEEAPVDLLLTDVVMPQMSGTELAERVTAIHPNIRVLFMSGYAAPVLDASQAIRAGAALIDKPFSEYGLLDKVREVLDRGVG